MDLISKIEKILSGIKLPNESKYYDSALEMIKETSERHPEIELPKDINEMKEVAEETVKSYRKEALRTVIDSYRKDYPLLEKVIRGETTFEKEYKPLIDKHSGIKAFFIPSWLTDKEVKVPKENKGMIHDYNLSDRVRALEKPATLVVYLVAMTYAVSTVAGLFIEFPKNIDIIMYVAAGLGFLTGMGFSEGTYKHKNLLKKDLKLLDKQIIEVYQKS